MYQFGLFPDIFHTRAVPRGSAGLLLTLECQRRRRVTCYLHGP